MPYGYRRRYGDVKRVFGTLLGYLETHVGHVDYTLVDTADFVAGNDSIPPGGVDVVLVEVYASVNLFEGYDSVALGAQGADGLGSVGVVAPVDAVLGTECRFVYLGSRRCRRDAAQDDAFDTEGVRGAKYRADVVERPDIVEDDGDRHLSFRFKGRYAVATHFGDTFLKVVGGAVLRGSWMPSRA